MAAINAVTLFFLLTSACIVLSLFTVVSDQFKTAYADVPQLIIIVIMTAGLALMIKFVRMQKRKEIISTDDRQHLYHHVHTLISIMGIMVFYCQGIILDINHFIAGFGCLPNWIHCNNAYVVIYHIVDLLYYAMRPVFMGLECVVCVIMACYSFHQGALITYGVAIIQSANIAICFQTIVSETFDHHHEISLDINFLSTSCWNHEHNTSWSHCPITANDTADINNTTDCCWPKDNQLVLWLESSNPSMYMIVVEFSLLVGEIMFEKLHEGHNGTRDEQSVQSSEEDGEDVGVVAASGGGRSHGRPITDRQNDQVDVHAEEDDGPVGDVAGPNSFSTRFSDVGRGRSTTDEQNVQDDISRDNGGRRVNVLNAVNDDDESGVHDQCGTVIITFVQQVHEIIGGRSLTCTKITLLVIPVVNDMIFVLVICYYVMDLHKSVYAGWKTGDEEFGENYIKYLWWSSAAYLLMICTTVLCWYYMKRLCYSEHARVQGLHSSGLDYLPLISSFGSFLLSLKRLVEASVNNAGALYIIQPLLNIGQVSSQIALLYNVKDAVLGSWHTAVLMSIMSLYNLLLWSLNSLDLPELYAGSVGWQTFDNVVGPLNAFFRFSSALLFMSKYYEMISLRVAHIRRLLSAQDHGNVNDSSEDSTPILQDTSPTNSRYYGINIAEHQENDIVSSPTE